MLHTLVLCYSSFQLLCSYMVDAADKEKIEASRNELHNLLDKPQLQGIPVRVFCFFKVQFVGPHLVLHIVAIDLGG